jgi:hypothetical protein
MKREKEFKKVQKSEVRESCISGDCDGICREKHYKDCPIHVEYYYEYYGRRKKKIYVNAPKRQDNDKY